VSAPPRTQPPSVRSHGGRAARYTLRPPDRGRTCRAWCPIVSLSPGSPQQGTRGIGVPFPRRAQIAHSGYAADPADSVSAATAARRRGERRSWARTLGTLERFGARASPPEMGEVNRAPDRPRKGPTRCRGPGRVLCLICFERVPPRRGRLVRLGEDRQRVLRSNCPTLLASVVMIVPAPVKTACIASAWFTQTRSNRRCPVECQNAADDVDRFDSRKRW